MDNLRKEIQFGARKKSVPGIFFGFLLIVGGILMGFGIIDASAAVGNSNFVSDTFGPGVGIFLLLFGIVVVICCMMPSKYRSILIYDNGFELESHHRTEAYDFSNVKSILAPHMGQSRNPDQKYTVTVAFLDGTRKVVLPVQGDEMLSRSLMEAHRDYVLGESFPDNLEDLSVDLSVYNGSALLENGIVYVERKRENIEFPMGMVEAVGKKPEGYYYITIKNEKEKLVISPKSCNNVLLSLAVCKAMANS